MFAKSNVSEEPAEPLPQIRRAETEYVPAAYVNCSLLCLGSKTSFAELSCRNLDLRTNLIFASVWRR